MQRVWVSESDTAASSSHGSQKGRQWGKQGGKGYNWAEGDIRLMDLGQSIETWDTSC